MPDLTATRQRRRGKRPRLRVERIVILVLLITAVIVSHHWPASPILIGRYAAGDGLVWSRYEGFLVAKDSAFATTEPGTLAFRTWEGEAVWTIELPPTVPDGWTATDPRAARWNGRAFSISIRGNVAAAACADGPRVRIVSWMHGKELGRVTLTVSARGPLTARAPFDLLALDNGTVLFWLANAPESPIVAIQGSRIQAVGRHRTRLAASPGAVLTRAISPDGLLLTVARHPATPEASLAPPNAECLSVDLLHDRIQLHPRFLLSRLQDPVFFDGAMMDNNGALYHRNGMKDVPDGWAFVPEMETTPTSALQHKGDALRVIAPLSGKTWGVPPPRQAWTAAVTRDGSLALVCDAEIRRLPGALAALTGCCPILRDTTGLLFAPQRLRLYQVETGLITVMALPGTQYAVRKVSLSPDGRNLLLHTVDPRTGRTGAHLYALPSDVWKTVMRAVTRR